MMNTRQQHNIFKTIIAIFFVVATLALIASVVDAHPVHADGGGVNFRTGVEYPADADHEHKSAIGKLLTTIFTPQYFEPHRVHFYEDPVLLWLLVIGNGMVVLAYTLIPAGIVYLLRKRRNILFGNIFWLYGAFIILCGGTHAMMILVFWYPIYWLEAILLLVTGIVSLATFISMLRIMPKVLKLKSPRDLEDMNEHLKEQIAAKESSDEELKQQNKELEQVKKAMLNALEDLEEEKRNLAENNAKDEAVLSSIADGLVAVDKDGRILLVNHAFTSMLGWSEEEVKGERLDLVVSMLDKNGENIPTANRPILKALLGQKTNIDKVGSFFYATKEGKHVPVSIAVAPVIFDGDVIGAVEVFRDVTHEREVDNAKTEFVSLASHQLRTPLSSVNWYTEMLLEGDAGELTEQQQKYLEEIATGNKRMVALVDALLSTSSLELGTFVAEIEKVKVSDLITSVLDEQKQTIQEKSIQVETAYGADADMPIATSPRLLRMVFQNLVSNAVKYTPANGSLRLGLESKDEMILATVTDTGWGIPKDQQDKIFGKLFRADNVKEQDTQGTGLGLYLVKLIVEYLGGSVRFESEEGKGTTFFVLIPKETKKKKKDA